MDDFLITFDVSDLFCRDSNEIELVKGKNVLYFATLGEDRVLYRILVNEKIEGVDKEIWYFYRIQSKYLAYCLGYARVDNEYLLIFSQNTYTVQDWFDSKYNRQIKKNKMIIEEFQKVLNTILQIFKFLFKLNLYLDDCTLNDFFLSEQDDVQLYNLSSVQQNNSKAHFISLSKIFSVLLEREINVFTFEQGFEALKFS
jgi:hypothetical protein